MKRIEGGDPARGEGPAAPASIRVLGRQQLRYRLGSDWIYDSRGTPPFVREDYGGDVAHIIGLDRANHWQLGQQLHYDQSRANATRTGLWLARLGYQRRLRPGHATDTLSQMRLTLLGGAATDTRNGFRDNGLAYGVDAAAILFAGFGAQYTGLDWGLAIGAIAAPLFQWLAIKSNRQRLESILKPAAK